MNITYIYKNTMTTIPTQMSKHVCLKELTVGIKSSIYQLCDRQLIFAEDPGDNADVRIEKHLS